MYLGYVRHVYLSSSSRQSVMELMRRSGRTKFSISILYASAFGVVVASRDGSAAFFSPRSSRWNRRSSAGQAPLAPAALSTCQRRLLQGDFGGIIESASASSSPPGSVAHSAHSSASPGQIETVRGELGTAIVCTLHVRTTTLL